MNISSMPMSGRGCLAYGKGGEKKMALKKKEYLAWTMDGIGISIAVTTAINMCARGEDKASPHATHLIP